LDNAGGCIFDLQSQNQHEQTRLSINEDTQWCEIRTTVFGWTRTRFPLHIRSTRELTINETPIITAIGKAFWDVGHAPKDQSNRRKYMPECAVWQIHPVMALQINQ